MEVDEIQRQASKFQRVSSTTTTDNSSNPQKIATHNGGIDVVVGGGRLCGWPSSRIVRVSRASGGKDRHSKVLTSKGLRDRRVRLSVSTAIQFYDLQDRLGYDQPSKAVEWLLKAASTSIDDLPSLDPSFQHKSTDVDFEDQHQNSFSKSKSKSPACSSTSETSKGSALSLSRSENRIKARERARGVKETRAAVLNQENSSFTDLLTGGTLSTAVRRPNHWTTPVDYNNIFSRPPQPSTQLMQMPQFNMGGEPHHFSFLQDSFVPTGGEAYNLNFSMTASSSSSGGPGFSRGTLQSNSPSSLLPHHHRFQSSSIDGSTSTNLPFFISDHFPPTDSQRLNLSYADHHKEKPKN